MIICFVEYSKIRPFFFKFYVSNLKFSLRFLIIYLFYIVYIFVLFEQSLFCDFDIFIQNKIKIESFYKNKLKNNFYSNFRYGS